MKTIQQILNISAKAYNYYLWQTWLGWADNHAKNPTELQALLANNALYNWWALEYARLEQDFTEKAKPYIGKVSSKELFSLYDAETEKIVNIYSKKLIKNALKTKVINHLQLN